MQSTAGKSDERKKASRRDDELDDGDDDLDSGSRTSRAILAIAARGPGEDWISRRSWISHRETIAQIVEGAVLDDDGQIQAQVETRGGGSDGLPAARCWAMSDVGWVHSPAVRSGPASRCQRTLVSSGRELRNACEFSFSPLLNAPQVAVVRGQLVITETLLRYHTMALGMTCVVSPLVIIPSVA